MVNGIKFVKSMIVLGIGLLSLGFMVDLVYANEQMTRPGKTQSTVLASVEPSKSTTTNTINSLNYTNNNDVTVKIRPLNLMLGQPLTIVIEGEHLGKSSAFLDWSHLKTAFKIDDVEQHANSLRITAYPLKAQPFTLQEQNAGLIHIPKTLINVANNPQVSIEWHKPNAVLYSSQQGVWQAQVKVANPAFLVEMKPSIDLQNKDVIVQKIAKPEQSTTYMISYEMPTVLSGKSLELKSPVIEVKNTTNRRWKFFDSPQQIEIKPLPIFLPMSVAVGQLNWQITPLDTFYQKGNLYYWNWQITGEGVSADYLKSTAYQLINQLEHNEQFSWLAESMQLSQSSNQKGQVTQLNIQVPFRVKESGLVSFPQLVLRSFNPLTGKVSQQKFASSTALALPRWIIWGVKWLALIMAIATGYLILLVAKQFWLNLKLRKALSLAGNGQEILQAILDWQAQHVLGANEVQPNSKVSSLLQLKAWYQYHYEQADNLATLLEDLNKLLYSKQKMESQKSEDFEVMKQNAKAWSESLNMRKAISIALKHALQIIKNRFKAIKA